MPSHKEHCEESLRRYGKTFAELHRWMDEPSEIMASKHRMYRHDPYTTPNEAGTLFGEYADQACLDHIRADRRAWRKEGLKVARPRGKSELPPTAQGILALFAAFFLFILGLVCVPNLKYGGWAWFPILVSWFLAFLFFLGFLGAVVTTKEEPSTVYHYELETPQYSIFKPEDEKQREEKTTDNKNDGKD